jgi:uncharacterized protein (DUF2141 family)
MATVITLFILLVSTAYAQTGTIAVKVTQIVVEGGGKVKIGIYGPKGFPEVGKEIYGINLEIKGTSVEYVFKDIPVGNYAIAVFQDVNNDDKLNKNLFGAPSEPYGFSKNQYGMFGPPDFEDVSFDLEDDKPISFTINLE